MKSILFLFSLCIPVSLFAQSDKIFWFAAPDVSSANGNPLPDGAPVYFSILAEEATDVTISQPANSSFIPVTFHLASHEHRSVRLDTIGIDQIENYPQALPLLPGNIQKKAFKITSHPGNITVNYDLENNNNRETFTLKGQNAMGKKFFVSTQNFFPNGSFSETAWSGFVIAATQNNTRIVVYPNDDWYYFDTNPGDSVVLMLNEGETFAFRAASTAPDRHINGVPVKSDKDIVITFYDDSIRKKNTANTDCTSGLTYDIIGDQLIPVNRTGKEYIILKGQLTHVSAPDCPADGGDRIFITSTEANTDIRINGVLVTTLTTEGQVFNYPVENSMLRVTSSKPVYITHITGYGGETASAVVPSTDNSAGSKKVYFSRSPGAADAFQVNLAIKNCTDFFNYKSIYAFYVYYDGGWSEIPYSFFKYTPDSSWIYLNNTPDVINFFNNQIPPGSVASIENIVTGFQLGILSGAGTSGSKYGYVSDFSPQPVKQAMISKDSLEVIISSDMNEYEWTDEWLFLRITDTLTNMVWYDSSAIVTKAHGFDDTIYLDSGTYKCEILDMGANVMNPVISVDNGHIVPWGYQAHQYYLFTIPGTYHTRNTIWPTTCDSLVSPSGKYTWHNGGTFFDTIPNSWGFDSLLTVNLDLHYSSSSVLNETACFSYTSPTGAVLENSGVYHQIITNAEGCDSSITINLTVIKVDNTVETIAGTMMAAEENADYQWLACVSGLNIAVATDRMYTPALTGLYAVRITKGGCTVTSDCVTITETEGAVREPETSFYPNPVADVLYIDLNKNYHNIEIRIDDMAGRCVLIKDYVQKDFIEIDTGTLTSGMYFVRLTSDGHSTSFKITK